MIERASITLAALPTLADYAAHYAALDPAAPALATEDGRWTYAQLADDVSRYARALHAAGIRQGDVVAVLSFSRPEAFIAFLAACRVGALYLGLNPKYTAGELEYVVRDARPRLVIGLLAGDDAEQVVKLRHLVGSVESIRAVVIRDAPGEFQSLATFLKRGLEVDNEVDLRPSGPTDACAIVYTSGSTGSPKGALLSQRGMIRSALLTWPTWYGSVHPLRTVALHPINHVGWLVCECVTALVAGGMLFFRERFNGPEVLRLVERERLNLWIAFPSMIILALESEEFDHCDLHTLSRIAVGTMPAIEILRKLQTRTKAIVSVSYGLTEAHGGAVTYTPDNASLETVASTIGVPVPGVELKLVDLQGLPVRGAEPGQLLVRDSSVFLGYLNRPEATVETIDSDGWLHTGDIASVRPDGNLRLVGRLKEMFKSGGYNVYPTEIEAVLGSHAAISAVAVVEMPDAMWTEVGVAYVVVKSGFVIGEVELRSFARERLANYKVPKRFILLDALPELPNGKFDKVQLRATARALAPT